MVTPTDLEFLTSALTGLCEPLHGAFSRGRDAAGAHSIEHGLVGHEFQPALNHLARAHAVSDLRRAQDRGELGQWVVGKPGPNTRLLLRNDKLTLKMLRPTGSAGSTPPPGPNIARARYFRNEQLDLLGVEGSKLIGLWSQEPTTGDVTIRVVRPIGSWKLGGSERVDVSFVLPPTASDLASLTFLPSDDGIFIEFPFDAEEGDTDARGPRG